MTGHWAIVAMDEFDESYFDLADQPPHLTITVSGPDVVRGEYAIGLSTGSLDGAVREFGGETIFVFGFAGMDEMDPVDSGTARAHQRRTGVVGAGGRCGAGWARLTGPDTLEGEFLGVLGRFKARRQVTRSARPAGRRR